MPKVLLPLLTALLLTALLSACGGGNPPSAAAVLELQGDGSVAVGAPARLSAVLRDASGNTSSATATYTSSQPGVIAVDAGGNLSVKRLTATDRPVEVTATAGGQSAVLTISTYGLELAVGTYVWNTKPAGTPPGRFVAVRYRPESGKSQAATYTVTAPNNETLTCPLSQNAIERSCWWAQTETEKYPAGEYRATLVQNGVTHQTTASLPAPEAVLGFVDGASAVNNGREVTFSGSVPTASRWLYSYVARSRVTQSPRSSSRLEKTFVSGAQTTAPVEDRRAVSVYSTALPAALKVGADVPAGSYDTWITAMSGNLRSFDEVLPEQFNVSATFGGKVTLP